MLLEQPFTAAALPQTLTASALRRFYFYYMFATEWDKSLLPAAPQQQQPEEQDAPAGAANGRLSQRPYDQTSVNLTADKPVRPPILLQRTATNGRQTIA